MVWKYTLLPTRFELTATYRWRDVQAGRISNGKMVALRVVNSPTDSPVYTDNNRQRRIRLDPLALYVVGGTKSPAAHGTEH